MAVPKHIHALHWSLSNLQEKRELLQQGSRVERDTGEPTLSHLSAANDFDALLPPLPTLSERLQLDAGQPAFSLAATSHTSEAGLEFIAEHEGMNLRLYNDPAGHATIGVGHLVHLGSINGSASEIPFANGISREQALELLQQDVGVAEAAVTRLVTVPLNQNQFDALVSFTFNVGAGNLENSSLLTQLNQGDYAAVPSELNRWNKASVNGQLQELPGLTQRRQAEGNLFATPPSNTPAVTPDAPSTAEVILKEGSRGEAVSLLQQKLQTAGFNPGPVDGVFGAKTASAVQDFQQSRGLTADGIVGPQTWRALDAQQPSSAVENAARVTTGSEQSKADLWVKSSANINQLSPEIERTLNDIVVVWSENNAPTPVITSGNDGRHSTNSFHYSDLAIDLRANNIPDNQAATIAADLQGRVGDDYDVIFERFPNNPANDHIHLEYDPN